MKGREDLLKASEKSLLIKYMLPSVAGMLGLSICILFDTMFIGRRMGELGLAALNIAVPLYSFYYAIALTFGVGGATALAIAIGQKKYHKANGIFTSSLISGILVIVIINIISYLFLDKICYMLGATKETFPLVKEYVKIILNFNGAFILSNILNVFIRSDKAPKLSMVSIIVTNIVNIALDYIFIYPMNLGMKGAALATTIAQISGIFVLLIHFFKKSNSLHLELKAVKFKTITRIIIGGMPSFVTESSAGFIIFVFNNVLLSIGGNISVSAYSIIANVALIFLAIFNGISQGMQPLISINYGARKKERVHNFLNLSTRITLLIGVIFFALGIVFPSEIIGIFSSNKGELLDITIKGIRIYFVAFIVMGVNIVSIAYLQAIQKTKAAFILSIFRGMILNLILVIILPKIFNLAGVWMTVPIVEIIIFISFMIYKVKNKIV